MGTIPTTGAQISMARVANAYGLGAVGTIKVMLNGVGVGGTVAKLGSYNRVPQGALTAGAQAKLSATNGGQTGTPNTY